MIDEEDLDHAVREGVLDATTAQRLRDVAQRRTAAALPPPDEERFRLIASFNDVFVVMAAALLIIAAASLVGTPFAWLWWRRFRVPITGASIVLPA